MGDCKLTAEEKAKRAEEIRHAVDTLNGLIYTAVREGLVVQVEITEQLTLAKLYSRVEIKVLDRL